MSKEKWIVGILGAAAVGGVGYYLYRKVQPSVPLDEFGNPEGTTYDPETGRGSLPRPPYFPGEQPSASEIVAMGIVQRQQDETVPATEGGLRSHPSGLQVDSRFAAHGRLVQELGPKARNFIIEQPGTELSYLSEGPRWVEGRTYLVSVEGEPILGYVHSEINPSYVLFIITDRPELTNWNVPGEPSWRTKYYDEEGRLTWPQYMEHPDPIYYPSRGAYQTEDGLFLPGYEVVWVNEIKHNCQHEYYSHLGSYRVWDPALGECRDATPEEAAAQEAWAAQVEEARRAEEEGRLAEQDRIAELLFGVSHRERMRLARYLNERMQGRPDRPEQLEMEVRNRELSNRMDWTTVADLWQYAPVYAPGGGRGYEWMSSSPESVAARRARGQALLDSWDPVKRREFERDYYSIVAGPNPPGRMFDEGVVIAVGGVPGLAAIWVPPPAEVYRPAPGPIVATRTGIRLPPGFTVQ